MRNPASVFDANPRFVPPEFHEMVDVADCALDDQLEQLQRRYAAASRAASRARFELELLEKRDAVPLTEAGFLTTSPYGEPRFAGAVESSRRVVSAECRPFDVSTRHSRNPACQRAPDNFVGASASPDTHCQITS